LGAENAGVERQHKIARLENAVVEKLAPSIRDEWEAESIDLDR